MNTELIKTVEQARVALKDAAGILHKVASGEIVEKVEVEHKAEAEQKPVLDEAKVRETFEIMAAAQLGKTAEIDNAVACVMKDPNELLGTIDRLVLRLKKTASTESEKVQEVRRPGKLVEKTASAFGTNESSVDRMRRRCAEAVRKLPTV